MKRNKMDGSLSEIDNFYNQVYLKILMIQKPKGLRELDDAWAKGKC